MLKKKETKATKFWVCSKCKRETMLFTCVCGNTKSGVKNIENVTEATALVDTEKERRRLRRIQRKQTRELKQHDKA